MLLVMSFSRTGFFAVVCAWLLAALGGAQSATETAHKDDFSQEPLIYQFVHSHMRYENDGSGTREVQARLRVQTAAGLERAGQLVFDYNAENEQIEIKKVEVKKPDGSLVVAGADAVQDLTSPVARFAPIYTDARQKHVTVPGLAVGDTLEYEVVLKVKPLVPGEFWHSRELISDAICLDEQLELNVPANRRLSIKSPTGLTPTIHEEGGRRIYLWKTSNLSHPEPSDFFKNPRFDPITLLKGLQPPPAREIMLSTLQSWAEVGHWYSSLERDRRQVTPQIRAEAEAITRGKASDLEKAQALYEWVSRNIRYVSLSFGVGRYQPHKASEVLENRYGDCKDKATLLETFYQAIGLQADTVLINSRRELEPEVPSPLQFDHAITQLVLNGKLVWLDSTGSITPYGYLLPQLRGKEALVVHSNGTPILERTPEALPFPALYRVRLKGSVDDQTLKAALSFETRGDLEVLMRLGFLTLPPAQFSSIISRVTADEAVQANQDFSFGDIKVGDVTDTAQPLHIELPVTAKLKTSVKEKKAPASSATNETVSGLMKVLDLGKLLPEGVDKGTDLGGPKQYIVDVELKLPENVSRPALGPEDLSLTRDFAEYDFHSDWQEHTLKAHWRIELKGSKLNADQSKHYIAFRKDVLDSMKKNADARTAGGEVAALPGSNPASASPKIVRTPSAAELFAAAQAELKQRNWANAEEKLQSELAVLPQDAIAWDLLGQAQMQLRKFDKAEASFRKLMEVAPGWEHAVNQVAWSLVQQKKFADVIEMLEPYVAASPQNGYAHGELGYAYLMTHKADKSVPELERAATLRPKDEYVLGNLARAYLQASEPDKAADAFSRLIKLDGNDTILNEAAYELANTGSGSHLDLAESWSSQAIHEIEVELNQAKLANLQQSSSNYVRQLSTYWDTMGWIKYKKNEIDAAEKYLLAAWQLGQRPAHGAHLGRVYELQGKYKEASREQAIEIYAETLAVTPGAHELSSDEKYAREQLAGLLGSYLLADARVSEAAKKLKENRTVRLSNDMKAEGAGQYVFMVGPASKVLEIQPLLPDAQLDAVGNHLRGSAVPFSFPDDTLLQLPLTGMLACAATEDTCNLTVTALARGSM
jgi:tetratricopeptide (TPR) repeat protein/transglutaminase-like putative cysteine protease